MPEHGLPRDEVMQQLITMKQDDQDWRGGRVFSLVYSAGDDVHELLSDALSLYSAENGLNVLAFPSIGVMQHDIVAQHRLAARRRRPGRRRRRRGLPDLGRHREPAAGGEDGPRRGPRPRASRGRGVVAGESAHAAFTKAADYFDVDLVRVPVGRRLPGQRPTHWPTPAPTTRSWWWAPRRPTPTG